jgi:hypothetical protein
MDILKLLFSDEFGRYVMDDQGLIPGMGRGFSSYLCIQTRYGHHPATCPLGTGSPFPKGTVDEV